MIRVIIDIAGWILGLVCVYGYLCLIALSTD